MLRSKPASFQDYNIGTLHDRRNCGDGLVSEADAVTFSPEELARSEALQAHFRATFADVFGDPASPRTVVIVPSITFDREVMARVAGVHHYEERLLCLLLLLRFPRTRVIYVTSTPIADPIIDYYLHLLPGIPGQHARKRLELLSCYDRSDRPLTAKILARPRLIQRIRDSIPDPHLGAYHLFHSDAAGEKACAEARPADLRERSRSRPLGLEERVAKNLQGGRDRSARRFRRSQGRPRTLSRRWRGSRRRSQSCGAPW